MHECKKNDGDDINACQCRCKGDRVGESGDKRACDGGMKGWIEEGVEGRKGTGKTGVGGFVTLEANAGKRRVFK